MSMVWVGFLQLKSNTICRVNLVLIITHLAMDILELTLAYVGDLPFSDVTCSTTCVLASDACECLLKSAVLEFGQLKSKLVKRLYYKSPDLYLVAVCS